MDKQTNPKIKIKINGDERPFKEDVSIHKWNSSEKETAATSEQAAEEEQFEWVLPDVEENPVQEFKKIYYEPALETSTSGKKFKKGSSSPFLTIIVSAVTAISIGVLFGFIMLKVIAYQSEGVSQKTLGDQGSVTTSGSIKKTESMPLPALSTSIIQGGVYDNATAAANDMKAKGLPTTIVDLTGKQYLFIGVSNKLETAKLMAEKLKNQNVEVYAKQFTIDKKNVDVTTADEQQFIKQTGPLFEKMTDKVSNAYLAGSINNQDLAEIKEQYKTIQGLENIKDGHVKKLFSYQSECYQSLLNFQKKNDEQEILKAEQALLSYIKQYNNM